MVAVGFAIKSTLTINDNEFEDKYYVIDVTDEMGNVEVDSFKLSPSELKVYTDIVMDNGATRTFNAYIEGGEIVQEFYVRTYTNDAPNGTPVSFNLTFAMNINTTQYLSQIVDLDNTSFECSPVDGIQGLYKVTLTLAIAGGVGDDMDIKTISGIDFTNFNVVDDLITVLNTICSETYTVTVNAEPVTA